MNRSKLMSDKAIGPFPEGLSDALEHALALGDFFIDACNGRVQSPFKLSRLFEKLIAMIWQKKDKTRRLGNKSEELSQDAASCSCGMVTPRSAGTAVHRGRRPRY